MATKIIGTGEVSKVRTISGLAINIPANMIGVTFGETLLKDGQPISPEMQSNWQFSVTEAVALIPEIQTIINSFDQLLMNDTKEGIYSSNQQG